MWSSIHVRERPFDFYGGVGRFFEKNNQDSDKDKQIDTMAKQTKKISRTVLKKDGQVNVKRQMGTN